MENMYVDTKVINPLKFIRIPGSINSKTGQAVSYKILDLKIKKKFSKDKSLEKEHKTTIKVTMNTKEYSNPKDYSKNKVLRLETLYNLNLTRIDDLEKILEMGYIEKGNKNEYLHIYSSQLVLLGKEKDYIMSKLKEINKIQKWFLHESELRYVVNSAIRNKYKYKNDTIINKLGLDIEIQSRLEIIKTSDEDEKKEIKNIKDKEKKKADRRNESGLTKREQNKKDTYESIQALKSKGLSQKQVALQLGVGTATVKRHWNV